jgi:hypothetical protein
MGLSRVARRVVVLVLVLCGLAAGTAPASASSAEPNTFEASKYVTSVYLDLFGRYPDSEGLTHWVVRLAIRKAPRVEVANAITGSEEFRSALITEAYAGYLGREPDAAGLRFWLDKMAHGWTIEQIESGFIASDEYYQLSGSTPAGWVEDLYADVLGRDAAPSEVSWWVGKQATGMGRPAVALGFLLSTEHLSTVIDGYYEYLLGRGLDATGQATWVGRIQQGGRDEEIIGGILASEEYWGISQTVSPQPPPAP